MSTADKPQADVFQADADDLLQYQSVSTLAVIGLLLGVASTAAFAAPLLLAIPLVACCVALAALANIRRSAGRLAGASLARWGLILAIVCGVGAVVRTQVRDALLDRQAAVAVDAWVQLVAQQQWEEAIGRLSGRGQSTLQPASGPGETQLPAAEMRRHMLDEIQKTPLAERLAQFDAPPRVVSQGRLAPQVQVGRRVTIQNRYRILSDGGDQPDPSFSLTVQLTRAPDYEVDGLPLRIDDWAVNSDAAP